MATEIMAVKGTTARRKDPACGTCRKKCRKCDRARPICNRCRSKGLHCEGYPPRFQFCEIAAPKAPKSDAQATGNQRGSMASSQAMDDRRPSEIPASISQSPPMLAEHESPLSTQASHALTVVSRATPPLALGSPELIVPESTTLSVSSPSSSQLNHGSPAAPSPARPIDGDWPDHQRYIHHFEHVLSNSLTISVEGVENPFREYLIPLAYQHEGVLHALLGLSACHMHLSGKDDSQRCVTASLQHRVAALHSVGALLLREEAVCLTSAEEEFVLAMILLLVFHDICESGVSSHGAHLTGVSFLCTRLACPLDFSTRSKAGMFFVSALSWLDMLRGFSGAEKLAYSEDVRKCVRDHGSLSLHSLVGCPPVLFCRIGDVLQSGKAYLADDLSLEDFKLILDDAEKFLRGWDPEQTMYPTKHPEWKQLAEAYRHACLLRVLRFPDSAEIPCSDDRIKTSVSAILDVCASMPRDSVFFKRLLFPLFMAGADTSSPHQIHYASWCVSEIKHTTGFQHPAMTELLTQVWEARKTGSFIGWNNVPWMQFTCSTLLESQHAYLFF